MAVDPLAEERLKLEQDRIAFERQKLDREIAREHKEQKLPILKWIREMLSTPLTIAIVGGFITVLTTTVINQDIAEQNLKGEKYKADLARQAARDALEADLIKKYTDGERDVVKKNLEFLVKTRLVPSYSDQIAAYLKENPTDMPQSAPSVVQSAPPPPASGAAQTPSAQSTLPGWNVDVFWCAGGTAEAATRTRATTIAGKLGDLALNGTAISTNVRLNRVQLRSFSQDLQRSGRFFSKGDNVVYDASPGEAAAAEALKSAIIQQTGVVTALRKSSGYTNQYLSVFVCPSA